MNQRPVTPPTIDSTITPLTRNEKRYFRPADMDLLLSRSLTIDHKHRLDPHSHLTSHEKVLSAYCSYNSGYFEEETILYLAHCRIDRYVQGTLSTGGLMYHSTHRCTGDETTEVQTFIFTIKGPLPIEVPRELKALTQIHNSEFDDPLQIRLICNLGVYGGTVLKHTKGGVVKMMNEKLLNEMGIYGRHRQGAASSV